MADDLWLEALEKSILRVKVFGEESAVRAFYRVFRSKKTKCLVESWTVEVDWHSPDMVDGTNNIFHAISVLRQQLRETIEIQVRNIFRFQPYEQRDLRCVEEF